MAEALAYLLTLALFGFVIVASARMRHDMLLLACIPPVFVALVVGFVMALYASDAFGVTPTGAALALGALPGWWLARQFDPRDLLLAIYLAWAAALVVALIAFSFPIKRRVATTVLLRAELGSDKPGWRISDLSSPPRCPRVTSRRRHIAARL